MNRGKKGAIYSVIALMLCLAVYLNWNYSKTAGDADSVSGEPDEAHTPGEVRLVDGVVTPDGEGEDAAAVSDDYFANARLSREKARDEAVSILNATVQNDKADADAKEEATSCIQVMAQSAMREARIENMIIAKGYRDCVVFINDNGVNVIVAKPEGGLKDADVARIKDIVMGEAGVTADLIKIVATA